MFDIEGMISSSSKFRLCITVSKLGLLFFAFLSCLHLHAQTFRIFEKPVVFDSLRKQLSLEYLKSRHHIDAVQPSIKPLMIVLHWTARATLEESYDEMNPSIIGEARNDIASASRLNICAQFLIDRDGTIFRQLPDTAFARHVIGLNYCAIGIENVGSDLEPLTEAQLRANEEVVRYLVRRHPEIRYLIGHYEYKKFRGDVLWKETDNNYLTEKTDPGVGFMERIRTNLKDLGLKGAP